MARLLKGGVLSEDSVHEAVMDWVWLHPDIRAFVIHIPNEGQRPSKYGAKLKKMGMRRGVSDLLVTMARHGYHGAWIEIKSEKGIVSLDQKRFHVEQSSQGYYCDITYGIDETIQIIEWYCYGIRS